MFALKLKTPIKNAALISKRWSSGALPFDPTILLGNVVHPEKFVPLKEIAKLQREIDGEEDAMQDNLRAIRSLKMLSKELASDVQDESFKKTMEGLEKNLKEATDGYSKKLKENLPLINANKKAIRKIDDHVESPLDFNKSLLKTDLPISSNTIKLNAQYFSFDIDAQKCEATILKIKSFVAGEVDSVFGSKVSSKVSNAVHQQTSQQQQEHSITGTLVITATCTHANASIFSPLVIDADKAVSSWNACYQSDQIVADEEKMKGYITEPVNNNNQLRLVSGATYGSCFVGMVHTLNSTSTSSNQEMLATAASLESNFKIAGWFADMEGGFGLNSAFAKNLQALLSQQSILSHVSLVCEGCIPTIASDKIAIGVKAFSDFNPASTMKQLATLHNETQDENQTVSSAADNAREGKKVTELRAADVKSTMSALSDVDDGKNSVLTVNSIMTAMDEYTKQAKEGKIGVPINFFLKSLTKAELAKIWIKKYVTKVKDGATEKKVEEKPEEQTKIEAY